MSDRRARPRAGLTRERVVDAALAFADEHGIAALSMRKLGAELGVEAMTLYHYVPSKEALFDALVDRLVSALAGIEPEPGGSGPEWLGRVARAYRQQLLAHPGVLPLAAARPAVSPDSLQMLETALQMLELPPARGLDMVNAVMTFVLGHTLAEAGRTPGTRSDMDSLAHLDEDRFPLLAQALRGGARHEERFEFALRALLAGLFATHSRSGTSE
ncbi:TetR family transcriptional regulator [Amycolatopsis echigonensis]|uniref:TetR family transcriptional regulator n=1 Tax=Amycolatopsis echigonensis TaxID=2576905 RepID=A0A2N3WDT0_9PSEU|nr:TetR family transcriptional regulator [Amycolatopsis niigatensis]